MKPFQIVTLFIFGALALLAVFIFASFSGGRGNTIGTVALWGSLPQETVDTFLLEAGRDVDGLTGVKYREVSEQAFTSVLVEALAAGTGPDLILFPASLVVGERDKIITIPYRSISRRDFQDSFVEAGEIFLTDAGTLGLPFYIDPFVLYWNRTLFSNAGVARPPRFWDELTDIAPKLSRSSAGGTLTQSAVALGEWQNVTHAKEIFLSLVYGLGNNLVVVNEKGAFQAVFSARGSAPTPPAESALRFYTDFADPVKNVYSWNRSQTDSRSAFLAGTLAVYMGKASEVFSLRSGNPNLNFDVAAYPQVRDGRVAVPADVLALSLPRGAKNAEGALQVAALLSGAPLQRAWASAVGLPSVRRDILSATPDSPYEAVFRNAALNAFTFYDPGPVETDRVFERMVEDVSSGRLRVPEAVQSGQRSLQALLEVQ